jgi:adenine-specific DNA methylase
MIKIEELQLTMLDDKCLYKQIGKFPSTRYQGSKLKIINWIADNIKDLNFESAMDVFGGSGSVAYMFKAYGKKVIYNDILKFNSIIGKALIENNDTILNEHEIDDLLTVHQNYNYKTIIQDNFKDIFYLEEENRWLDIVVTNIRNMSNSKKQAIAWFALFQSCIIKRPYNLFHRANLYMRTNDTKRSFGNKTTWDTPFETHFRNFVKEANESIFDNDQTCISINYDAKDIPLEQYNVDLVYIDTPYITGKGIGTDYLDFYHFLEGMVDYDNWLDKIQPKYKHKSLIGKGENVWTKKAEIFNAFDELFNKYKDSIIVVSYRADGIPSELEILSLLKKYKSNIKEVNAKEYKYALSKSDTKELLFIGY